MLRLLTACLSLCVVVAGPLSAQHKKEVLRRIRLTLVGPDSKSLIGTPVSLGTDMVELVLSGTTDTVKIPRASIRKLEESKGRRSSVGRGAAIGSISGAVLGLIAIAVYAGTPDDSGTAPLDAAAIGVGLGGGALFGTLVGSAIGAMSSHERWSVRPAVTLNRGPVTFRVGATLRVTF
jgi:hypothetical protein